MTRRKHWAGAALREFLHNRLRFRAAFELCSPKQLGFGLLVLDESSMRQQVSEAFMHLQQEHKHRMVKTFENSSIILLKQTLKPVSIGR